MTEEEVKRIYYDEYIGQHIGAYTLQKKYNHRFYKDFRKYNLPTRNDVEKNKKYTCNDDYFKIIDTEGKAYWLGFLMADGFITIHGNGKKVGISLQAGDYSHLEKFKQATNSDTPIHTYTVKAGYKPGIQYARIIITSTEMVEDLISHGCVEHKSNILQPPVGIPDYLQRHWVRGYMDGNGSITISKNGQLIDSYSISVTSTNAVLNWIMDVLLKDNIIQRRYPITKRKEHQIVGSFGFGGNNLTKKYCDYIYHDASVYLDRKYERYLKLCDLIKERDERIIPHKCDVCNTTHSNRFLVWHGEGEYNGKILCEKHYNQLYKNNRIMPDKKDSCEICGDTYGKMTQCGVKYMDYYGVTMCRKHYEQIYVYGKITDSNQGRHKSDN